MTVYSGETNSYQDACRLIKRLQAAGIESCLTSGAVSINCKPDQVNLAQEICEKSNAAFRCGYIGRQQELLLKSLDGVDLVKQRQNDARSVVDEWKNE